MFCVVLNRSGQTAIFDKSNILFFKNTSRANRRTILDGTGFKVMGSSSIYLGNSLVLRKN